jgi:hypothetical protein
LTVDGPRVAQDSDQEIIAVAFPVQITKVAHQGARVASPGASISWIQWKRYRGSGRYNSPPGCG